MPRHFLKRYMPHPDRIRDNKTLSCLGHLLHDPNLWHLNRHSVSRAVAIGLFWALIPAPMQMLLAALCAIPARANLAIAAALVWLTNPLTLPMVFYANYLVGSWLLNTPAFSMPDELTLDWVYQLIKTEWKPLYLGSLTMAVSTALSGYWLLQLYWRLGVQRSWKQRRRKPCQGSTDKQDAP